MKEQNNNQEKNYTRRQFIQQSALLSAGVLLAAGSNSLLAESSDDGMSYRTLGRTGERVSVIGLGGWHIGQPSLAEHESIQRIRQAIDRGITFMDNCWDYNEGASQVRMGKALKDGYRQKVFLMDKIDGRTKAEAARQIDTCLQRLQTDRIDLMQFQVARAREYFARSAGLLPLLPLRSRLCPAVLRGLYLALLDRIEARGYDVFATRVRLSTSRKLILTSRIWLQTVAQGLLTKPNGRPHRAG